MVNLATNHTPLGGAKPPPTFTKQHASKYLKRGFDSLVKRDFKDAGACAQVVLKPLKC